MKIVATRSTPVEMSADVVVLGVYETDGLDGWGTEIDQATGGAITRLAESGELSAKEGKTTSILAPAGLQATRLVCVGLGNAESVDRGRAFRAAAAAAKAAAGRQRHSVAFFLGEDWSSELVENAVCGAMVGCRGQDLYRAEPDLHPFEELHWATTSPESLEAGQVLGQAVNETRRLVNEPPSDMNPVSFAAQAQKMAEVHGLEAEVWDQSRLEQERCGALLAVARGSVHEPRLVSLRHAGGAADDPWLALVGKGVTFDSGGLSLKPTDGMKTMKCDMAGAATVVGAMQAIADLKLPVNVMGLAGLVENMVSGDSYKLGDVLRARNGTTIEVLNTDAEGRLVLADVLDVACERGASHIVDLATLTGACLVALGSDVAGLMTNDDSWCARVAAAAERCGELVWQLPMFELYDSQIKSQVADIKNVGDGRWGGAITAAKFLQRFVGGTPWTHVDIAGPSFLDKPKGYIDAGATGCMVRTLVDLARAYGTDQNESAASA